MEKSVLPFERPLRVLNTLKRHKTAELSFFFMAGLASFGQSLRNLLLSFKFSKIPNRLNDYKWPEKIHLFTVKYENTRRRFTAVKRYLHQL